MISCTEFIPLYSEFFKFLEKKGGHDAVMNYWICISDNNLGDKSNPNSLASFCERYGGFEGAINYWKHTLTEEACDLQNIYDYNKRYCYEHMRHCPSRGMLNSLKHIEPYYDYCGHCKVIYSRVLEKYGVVYEMDHSKIANAECSSLLFEEGNRPTGDYTKIDDTKVVMDIKPEDNKYLHRDFHILGDFALSYCGEHFGDDAVTDFLTEFTKKYFAPKIDEFKKGGLIEIQNWLERIYEVEESGEVLHCTLSDNVLNVKIDYCPAIKYMKSLYQSPGKYYIRETETIYRTIAEEAGFKFDLKKYEPDGKAEFEFYN